MITLSVLLVMAVSVLGNQNLEEVCPSDTCYPFFSLRFSDKPALNIHRLYWPKASDVEVVKATPNLEHLKVYNCSSDFKMDIFPPLPALTKIEITNCSISELPKNQFENVINLNSLELTGNSIEILYNETFYKLSRLRVLDLQNNLIQNIPEGVFNPLESLCELNMDNNNISMLPKDTFLRNLKLKSISLNGNPLKIVSLDFPIWTPENILQLNLVDCVELRDLRLSIDILSKLSLENSGVERLQITGRIGYIYHKNCKVTRADFSEIYFGRAFAKFLCEMPSLESLALWKISKSSDYSYFELYQNGKKCEFPNLRSLNMAGNKLNFIPISFSGPNLTTLDLSQNLLDNESLEFDSDTSIDEEDNLPNLRFLNMAYNKIKNIPRNLPLFGPNLTILDLSYNLLQDLSLESFAKAHNLQSLSLGGNQLTTFDYISVCDGLMKLKRLALYENKFNATFYHNMTKYLGDNGLEFI